MQRVLYISAILFLLVALLAGGYFSYTNFVIEQSVTQNEGEYVVLLHGLGRTSLSMQKIGKNLVNEGYRVINIHYPSRSAAVETLTEEYILPTLEEAYVDKEVKINFVTHSMGGIITRYLLENYEIGQVGRVVMMAPPNTGSDLADTRSRESVYSWIMGPALGQLTTDTESFVNTLPLPMYEVGIIAGEFDEKVSVEHTKLSNMKDFMVVPREHTWIMNSSGVIQKMIQFLKTGNF